MAIGTATPPNPARMSVELSALAIHKCAGRLSSRTCPGAYLRGGTGPAAVRGHRSPRHLRSRPPGEELRSSSHLRHEPFREISRDGRQGSIKGPPVRGQLGSAVSVRVAIFVRPGVPPRLRPIDRPGTSRSLPIFESGCTRTGRLTGKCRQLDSTFGGKQNAGDLGGPKIDLKTQSKSQFGYRVRACTCSSFLGCTSSTWNQRTFRLRPRYRTTFEHFGSPTPRPWAPTTGVWNVQL